MNVSFFLLLGLIGTSLGQSTFQVALSRELLDHTFQQLGSQFTKIFEFEQVELSSNEIYRLIPKKAEVSLTSPSSLSLSVNDLSYQQKEGAKELKVSRLSATLTLNHDGEEKVSLKLTDVVVEGSEEEKRKVKEAMEKAVSKFHTAAALEKSQYEEHQKRREAGHELKEYSMKHILDNLPPSMVVAHLAYHSLLAEKAEIEESAGGRMVVLASKGADGKSKKSEKFNPEDLSKNIYFRLEQDVFTEIVRSFSGKYSLREEVLKNVDARQEYYQRNLRVMKLEPLFPDLVEEFDPAAPYDFQLLLDQDYYKKVIKNAKPSSLKIGKNGETTMLLNVVMVIAIDNSTREEMIETITGRKKPQDVPWTTARSMFFTVQAKGKMELEYDWARDAYNVSFEQKSVEVPQVKVFFGEPLAEKEKRKALSDEELENEESQINSNTQMEGILFQSVVKMSLDMAKEQLPKKLIRSIEVSTLKQSPFLACLGLQITDAQIKLVGSSVEGSLGYAMSESSSEGCAQYDLAHFDEDEKSVVKAPQEIKELLGFLKQEVREQGATLLRMFVSTYQDSMGMTSDGLNVEQREKASQERMKEQRKSNKEAREKRNKERLANMTPEQLEEREKKKKQKEERKKEREKKAEF